MAVENYCNILQNESRIRSAIGCHICINILYIEPLDSFLQSSTFPSKEVIQKSEWDLQGIYNISVNVLAHCVADSAQLTFHCKVTLIFMMCFETTC